MSLIDDGNQEPTSGGTEQPTSSPSGGNGQQLSDVGALVKEVTELRKEIRGIQKGTDKRFERQDQNIKRILELKEQGLNENQIARELMLDSILANQQQNTPPAPPAGSESKAGQAADVESAFKTVEEYGLSTNDPEFIALIRKGATPDKVKDYVLNKVKPPKPANPADVVQPPSLSGASSVDIAKLSAEMQQLYKNPSAPGAMKRITEIREALEKAG